MALGPDFRPAEESNTGGTGATTLQKLLHLPVNLGQGTEGGALINY